MADFPAPATRGASPGRSLVGIGLRHPHGEALLRLKPPLGFVEAHTENFFADGGASLAWLDDVRAHHPVSLHGVGLSLGSATGLDAAHLDKLAALTERIRPVRVSEHVSFGRLAPGTLGAASVHAADLLPVAFTAASLDILVEHVQQVQERLQRPILVENLSASLRFEDDHIPEGDFLVSLCRRSGCRLLLDLNNLLVNGLNRIRQRPGGAELAPQQQLQQAEAQALDLVWGLSPPLVGQIHLAGFRWPDDPQALIVDDHSQRVSPTGWSLYRQALAHLGPLPTAIEWDTDLPGLAVLLDEARQAGEALAEVCGVSDAMAHGGQAGDDDEDVG